MHEPEYSQSFAGRPALEPPRGSAVAEPFDPIDCFNADLVWIMNKLVDRTGGHFGVLSRHLTHEKEPVILAEASVLEGEYREWLPEIARQARLYAPFGKLGVGDDVPAISSSELESFRLLHLAFSPAEGVELVATVCKSATGFLLSAFHDMTAVRVYPVLSRYIRLWWMHRMERRRANSLTVALDLSDFGVLLLNQRGGVVFANTRVQAFFDNRDGLQTRDGQIAATDAPSNMRLQAAIQHALHLNSLAIPEDVTRQRSPILALQRTPQLRSLIVTVMHVGRPAVDSRDPAVILYVIDPDQSVEHLLAPACGMYKLTAVESRLVHHLVRGLKLEEAAQAMRVRPDTARTYLKQVFAKTMTHRQAELMRVMLTSMTRTSTRVLPTLL